VLKQHHKCYQVDRERERGKEITSDLLETDLFEDTGTGNVTQVFHYNPETKC
jgi:hypothetical protein